MNNPLRKIKKYWVSNAEKLELEIQRLQALIDKYSFELIKLGITISSLQVQLSAQQQLNGKLTETNMRARLTKKENVYAIQMQVTEEMLLDIYRFGESDAFEKIIGGRIKQEFERKAWEVKEHKFGNYGVGL